MSKYYRNRFCFPTVCPTAPKSPTKRANIMKHLSLNILRLIDVSFFCRSCRGCKAHHRPQKGSYRAQTCPGILYKCTKYHGKARKVSIGPQKYQFAMWHFFSDTLYRSGLWRNVLCNSQHQTYTCVQSYDRIITYALIQGSIQRVGN